MTGPRKLLTACVLFVLCSTVATLMIQTLTGNNWKVDNGKGIQVAGTVPGSIYTDLMRAGRLEDPYYRFNDVEYRWVSFDNWTYTGTFQATSALLYEETVELVCDGIDTVSDITLNGKLVGSTDNMFIRYVFDIKGAVKVGANEIRIAFQSAVNYAKLQASTYPYRVPPQCPPKWQRGECHGNMIRKESCSFSWDWGPAFPTQGVWRNLSIQAYSSAVIRDLTSATLVKGQQWYLEGTVYFSVSGPQPKEGSINFRMPGVNLNHTDTGVTLSRAQNLHTYSLKVPAEVNLWWPNGHGDQPLYDLEVTFISTNGEVSQKKIRVGFRTVELVQEAIPGTKGISFYFKINGKSIFMKGSNWIPADIFQERVTKGYLQTLLQSAKEANMNMLRVSGVGVYESDEFYKLADELGILLWHDLMYACAMYPTNEDFLDSVRVEITQQVRRLKHHASIALWAGNNENEEALRDNWYQTKEKFELYYHDYLALYRDTIRPVVLQEDTSRPFLMSSPSNGVISQKEGWLAANPQDPMYGDIHHYDYVSDSWNWTVYPIPRFATEYGMLAWCSFEALRSVSVPQDWEFFSNFSDHRQHHGRGNEEMMRQITLHFKLPTTKDRAINYSHLIYLTQVNQAMGVKAESELLRRMTSSVNEGGYGRTMGALYWQLNDIWQAPTWASTEYSTGKWKMLHYYAKNFFSPTMLSPYIDGEKIKVVYITDEGPSHKSLEPKVRLSSNRVLKMNQAMPAGVLTLLVQCFSWDSLKASYTWRHQFTKPTEGATLITALNFHELLKQAGCTIETCFLHFTIEELPDVPANWYFPSYFNKATGLRRANIKVTGVTKDQDRFDIGLQTDALAPFVWLEAKGTRGRFSDNGFILAEATRTVTFYAWEDVSSTQELMDRLSVMSLMDLYQ